MDNWNKMKPVLKISIIMGPMWIFEMIAWAIGNHGTAISEAQKSFTFFNVINSLQVSKHNLLKIVLPFKVKSIFVFDTT